MFRRRETPFRIFLVFIMCFVLLITASYAKLLTASSDNKVVSNGNIMGDIVDDQDNLIVEHTEKGRHFIFPHMYNNVVGYKVGREETGLFSRYRPLLYESQYSDNKGSTLHLTTNNEVQQYCYRLLENREGAIVVLEKDSGKIVAIAQSNGKTYDANKLDKDTLEEIRQTGGYFTDRAVQSAEAPGSTFKAFITGLMVENKKEGTRYLDEGKIKIGDLITSNNNGTAYGVIDLSEALIHSSNAYFINAGVNVLGKELVNSLEKKFLLNQDIDTDVGTLHADFPLKEDYSKAKLGQTSFGQGEMAISPLYLAMMYQGLATGSMKKPYLVEEAITKGGKSVYKAEVEELSKPFSKEVCKKVSDYLKKVAIESYQIDPKLHIRAKTGTATIAKDVHHSYVASYDDKYVVVISDQRAQKSSYEMATEDLPGIYEKLHEVYSY